MAKDFATTSRFVATVAVLAAELNIVISANADTAEAKVAKLARVNELTASIRK
jgi:hypothetical protein